MRGMLARPKGRQYPNVWRSMIKRTNWEGAGKVGQFSRFWPSDQEPGSVIQMYDETKYQMATGGGNIVKPGGWRRYVESVEAGQ